jgi:hypothetical protein
VLARIGDARIDVTLDNNNLDSNPTALADINIVAGSSAAGETASVYANIINNDVLAGGPTNVLRLRVADGDGVAAGANPQIFLEGFVEGGPGLEDDVVATWNANGNTPTTTTATVNLNSTAGATPPSAGVAQVPDNAAPLMAHGLADRWLASEDMLGQDELDAMVQIAIQHWADAGADAGQIAAMQNAQFGVASLAGLDLGLTAGNSVLIDDNAAGYGWSTGEGSGGGMDLLTVVLHELGHIAGFGDHVSHGGDMMHGFLDAGVSRLPEGLFGHEADFDFAGPEALNGVFAGGGFQSFADGFDGGMIGSGGDPFIYTDWP